MKKIYFLVSLIWSFCALAQGLDDQFKSLLSQYGIAPLKEQAYCYQENNQIIGFRPAKLQRIASLTKLFSTLLISETTNLNSRYTTRIFIGKDSLHIAGGLDPYFEEEKLLLLFQALNDLKYTSFKKVTFSSDFLFYDIALGEYEKITPEKTRARLAYFMNASNKSFVATKWATVRKFAQEEGVDLEAKVPFINSRIVQVSDINPLLNENPVILTHVSLPLHRILKSMNVQSKNFVAENIYLQGLKKKSMESLLTEKKIPTDTFKIYNGSGLPIINGKDRLDNLATCETLLKVFGELALSLNKQNFTISDIIAVAGGKDRGSFKERFLKYPELHESVVSKTGTLKHTSSLGGFLLNGKTIPFAILNHTTDTATAKKFQDNFVAKMFDFLGAPEPIIYEKISIFPWTSEDFFNPLLY